MEWVRVYENCISDDFCDCLITLFESKQQTGIDQPWRRCKNFTELDKTEMWPEFKNQMKKVLQQYIDDTKCNVLYHVKYIEAPNIFRYDSDSSKPNFFADHSDNWSLETATRQVSIICYLNNVPEDGGGETEFTLLKKKIHPKKGRVLVFPSFYTHIHRGNEMTLGTKYIVVSWFHLGDKHYYRTHLL